MSIVDALARIGQIQQQITQLADGALPTSAGSATTSAAPASSAGGTLPATTGTDSASFAGALAQAQGTSGAAGAFPTSASGFASPAGLSGSTLGSGLLVGGPALPSTGGAALPPAASSMLTSGQQQFASRLAASTGLSPGVVTAWLLAEENGGAAQSRQAAGNNDWLNIGYTDAGTYGSADSVWSNPITAADATAGWLKGQDTIPGYGTASAGVQGILNTVGQSPAAQIYALQHSGWASGGYPELGQLYAQITGGSLAA
jgi:hypothetical protein